MPVMKFSDVVEFDNVSKKAVSVRDGILEYYGSELGMQPADKVFTVFRSSATIANTASLMIGIPVTDGHVDLDSEPPNTGSSVESSKMIDTHDDETQTMIAIENQLILTPDLIEVLQEKKQLSLGYQADLIPHDKYDFEQVEIKPHHLGAVEAGRCGSMCCFIDRKGTKKMADKYFKTLKAQLLKLGKKTGGNFKDKIPAPTMQEISEMATALGESIKHIPADKLLTFWPTFQAVLEFGKSAAAAPEDIEAGTEDVTGDTPIVKDTPIPDADPDTPPPPPPADPAEEEKKLEDEKKAFGDALSKGIQLHTSVMDKARTFLDESYIFSGKTTKQIMSDAVKTEYPDTHFSDQELVIAFKMLKQTSDTYRNFGDSADDDFMETLNGMEL